MDASANPLPRGSYEIRVHDNGGYGSAWQWCCVASPKDPGSHVAWITLALGAPSTAQRRALEGALRRLGYTHYQWERRTDGDRRITKEFAL